MSAGLSQSTGLVDATGSDLAAVQTMVDENRLTTDSALLLQKDKANILQSWADLANEGQ